MNDKHSATLPHEEFPNGHLPEAGTIRIVAVDDEPFALEGLKRMFQHAPKEVALKTFTDSSKAWEDLLKADPDLLITDDAMPGLRGEAICRRLLERKVTYPIVVISPWPPTEHWVRECASQGLNVTFLPTPFDIESFQKALGRFGEYVVVGKQNREAHICG